MDLLHFVSCRALAGGLVLVTGVACVASSDPGINRWPDGRSSNPLEPPLACTMIGCDDGLRLELRPPSGWPAGEYRFDVQMDGADVTCRGSIPLPECTDSRGSAPAPSVRCHPEGVVRITESGCALPAGAQGFPELSFDPKLRPRNVEITITRNGQIVGGANLRPSFQRVRPNGPDCPPACEMARAVLDLDLWVPLADME